MPEYNFNPAKHKPNRKTMAPGRYVVAIVKFDRRVGQSSGMPYVRAELVGVSPAIRGCRLWTNLSFAPTAIWKLGTFAEAMGITEVGNLMTDGYLRKFCGVPFQVQISHDRDEYDVTKSFAWGGDNDPYLNHTNGLVSPEGTGTITAQDGARDVALGAGDAYEQEEQFESEQPQELPPSTPVIPPEDDEDIPF